MLARLLHGARCLALQRPLALTTFRAASTLVTPKTEGTKFPIFNLRQPQKARTPESLLMAQPWTTTPFSIGKELQMPVFNLLTGQYRGVFFRLDHDIFNQPLRRDIVAKVLHYFNMRGRLRTKVAKTVGDVRGTGKKPVQQKGRGAARQGNKRAPQRKKGGAAHGPKFQDLQEKINGKLRSKALKIMLSAKLYENKIVIIETEKLQSYKTAFLDEILRPLKGDRLLFLTSFNPDKNFELAASNIPNLTVKNPQQLNVPDLVRNDKVFLTSQGLQELEEVIRCRDENLYRNRKVPTKEPLSYKRFIGEYKPKRWENPVYNNIIKPAREEPVLAKLESPENLEVFTPSVNQYLEDLKQFREEQKL